MNKKTTAIVGMALGATLVAGYSIYKFFSKKGDTDISTYVPSAGGIVGKHFIGNSLVKSENLYGGSVDNGLVGGGLYKV